MKNIKKLWITTSSGGSFPFWETEITDNEELKNEYDDFKNSLCLVSYDDFKEEKEKVEKLRKCLLGALQDVSNNDLLDEISSTLKEIEANYGK